MAQIQFGTKDNTWYYEAPTQRIELNSKTGKGVAKKITIPTAGKFVDKNIVIDVKEPEIEITKLGSFNNDNNSAVEYTENLADNTIIPAGGYLYINEGWYDNTKISLGHMIPDPDENYSNAGVSQMLHGYIAYDGDGNKIIGTMADVNPTFTGGDLNIADASLTLTGDNIITGSTGIPVIVGGSVQVSADAINYTNVTVGYINKSEGESAIESKTANVLLEGKTFYINNINIPESAYPFSILNADSTSIHLEENNSIFINPGTFTQNAQNIHIGNSGGPGSNITISDANSFIDCHSISELHYGGENLIKNGEIIAGKIEPNTTALEPAANATKIECGGKILIKKGWYSEDVMYQAESASSTSPATLSAEAENVKANVSVSLGNVDEEAWKVALNISGNISGTAKANTTSSGYATVGETFATGAINSTNISTVSTFDVFNGSFTLE